MDKQLSRSDVLIIYGWSRSTLGRLQGEGLRFINGRISEHELVRGTLRTPDVGDAVWSPTEG